MTAEWFLYLLAGLLVLAGLAGTVLPALPGVPLVFAGLLVAAWTDGFERVSWGWLALLGVLTLSSIVVDLWAGAAGAYGGERRDRPASPGPQVGARRAR